MTNLVAKLHNKVVHKFNFWRSCGSVGFSTPGIPGIPGSPIPAGASGSHGDHGPEGPTGSLGNKGDEGPCGRQGLPASRVLVAVNVYQVLKELQGLLCITGISVILRIHLNDGRDSGLIKGNIELVASFHNYQKLKL